MNKDYIRGFVDKCAQEGVDAQQLVRGAAGTGLAGIGGMLAGPMGAAAGLGAAGLAGGLGSLLGRMSISKGVQPTAKMRDVLRPSATPVIAPATDSFDTAAKKIFPQRGQIASTAG